MQKSYYALSNLHVITNSDHMTVRQQLHNIKDLIQRSSNAQTQ